VRPVFLHLDNSLAKQPQLLARGGEMSARQVAANDIGPSLRLWARPQTLARLRQRLHEAESPEPELTFAGSGDFHHVASLLIERLSEQAKAKSITVLHFDNHPDWVRFENGMHCGSWVGSVAHLPAVARVITVGVCSRDIVRPNAKSADLDLISDDLVELYAYRNPTGAETVALCGREWPTIGALGSTAVADLLMRRIATDDVYITIDKDVLHPDDAVTNWDQGEMKLKPLVEIIRQIRAKHRVVGADIVGDWSPKIYAGDPVSAVLKRGEALMDQPWRSPDQASATAINEAANIALLDAFSGARS
jgi:hypothetical protein